MRTRTHADSQFDVAQESEITLPQPYRKEIPRKLNKLGIPEKPFYRAADVARLLHCSVDLVLWRLRNGKYELLRRTDSCGRRVFTLQDLETIQNQTRHL
jgi:hypothetical protein